MDGDASEDMTKLGREWLDKLRAAEKREETWIANAGEAEKAFLSDADSEAPGMVYEFNILHSNVETLAPAIFNSTPEPDIRERFRIGRDTPESALAQQVASVYERAIRIQIDDGKLTREVEGQVQDALVAGRGILRIRFDADEVEGVDPMTGEPVTSMTNERLRFEAVSWRDYREGPAKRWSDVPWVAYRHVIPEEELERIRDPELKAKLSDGTDPAAKPILATDDGSDVNLWEIWERETRRVLMLVEHSGEIISIVDDPLGLAGFFPQAAPIQPICGTGKRTPVTPFIVYRALARELEDVTRRIRAIISAVKVKAAAAGNMADLAEWADAGDNTITAIANLEALAQTGGIDKAMVWWPVEQAIVVLRELYVMREGIKQAIYEITGISDIVRGASEAGETATAQQIKTQWGSLRIRKLQRLVEAQIRDVFVICAEVMASKFSPESLMAMTAVQLPPEAAQMLAAPLDHYRIDVETNSTIKADLTERRAEMGQFLEGTGAFFQSMAPLVAQAPAMAGPVSEMYAAFARQFSLGKQAEDAIEKMAEMAKQAAQAAEGQPTPQEQAMQAEQEAQQMQMAMEQQKMQLEAAKMQAEVEIKQAELEIKRAELQLKQAEMVIREREAELQGVKTLADTAGSAEDRDFNREQAEKEGKDDG